MDDYGSECSMCGKPMSYRFCGMCISCEQIDNDVPENPLGHWEYISRPCPDCGGRLQQRIKHLGEIDEYDEMCDDCEYAAIFYD